MRRIDSGVCHANPDTFAANAECPGPGCIDFRDVPVVRLVSRWFRMADNRRRQSECEISVNPFHNRILRDVAQSVCIRRHEERVRQPEAMQDRPAPIHDEIRNRVRDEHNAKELCVVPRGEIVQTLEQSGYRGDSALSTSYSTGWGNPEDEARSLAWLRRFYGQVFAATGGVPVPGEASNGATINHPDVDLREPEWNRSGVPWSTLYYRDNYPRLQRAKARWDPRNGGHRALELRRASASNQVSPCRCAGDQSSS